MTILSLQLGHNSTAALLIDGEIKGVISEEKFDNIKNSSSFPENSIKWLLNEFNVKKVDYIAMSGLKIYPSQMEVFKESINSKNKISLFDKTFLYWDFKGSFFRIFDCKHRDL